MADRYSEEEQFWDRFYKDIDTKDIVNEMQVVHSMLSPHRKFCYYEQFFQDMIKEFRNKRILSIGGGIDSFALYLAEKGNYVDSIDISKEAVVKTSFLAQKLNVDGKLRAYCLNWEKEEINKKFDVVIIHEALHHMNTQKAITKIYDVLEEGGCLVALEPICLLGIIRFFHRKFPFHPAPFYIHPEGEMDRELEAKDLSIIKKKFKNTAFHFFDMLTRESIFYFLYKVGLRKILKILGSIDYHLARKFPVLQYFGSYIICKAYK